MKTYIALSSIAMDLKRVALGYYKNSMTMAQKFYLEALKRKRELDGLEVKPYLDTLLKDVEQLQYIKDQREKAERALMMSTLFQNAAMKAQQL
jgi:hypothetical protein